MGLRRVMLTPLRPSMAVSLGAVAVTLLASATGRLSAEPLTADACERLRAEKGELLKAGVAGNMNRGPAWAKANLDKAKLGEIERYLDVEDALAFRCARPLPPEVQKAIEAETATPEPPAQPTAPKAKQKGTRPLPPAKAASGNAQDGTDSGGGGADASASSPAPKPKVRRPPPAKTVAPKSPSEKTAEPKAP